MKFLANPALKGKPGDAKRTYLQTKMKLTESEVAEGKKNGRFALLHLVALSGCRVVILSA